MKALSDTNPLVSALLQPSGPSGQIFQRWRKGDFEMAVSPATLAELNAVLRRSHIVNKYLLGEADVENHLNALRAYAEIAPGVLTLDVVHEDEMDNHVLAAAVETEVLMLSPATVICWTLANFRASRF